ncbi:carboxymuconolactone decarboxylase family protein [Cumulibacter manganitolerans]|uniref:carboxymuconolactone decarboxylase family protein n=1 Tax=Cumulibacter manganitolerans TaxID=1884992 RepID=UPI0012976389|nr:carboxymuconolactone decarboxylase family protein [Cumulibacter manganitolerans]
MTEPVLRPLGPDDLTDEQRPLYDAILGGRRGISTLVPLTDADGALLGPFDPILRTPAIGQAIGQLGLALRNDASLPRAVNETAILTTSVHWAAEFEWYAHAAIVRDAAMMAEDDLEAIRAGRAPGQPEIALAWRAARAILAGERIPGPLVEEVTGAWGERGLVELCAIVGHYSHLALLLRALGIEPPR